jgi:phosphate transport system substrate-binding protein
MKIKIYVPVLLSAVFFCCKDKVRQETMLKGTASVYTDESLAPIVEDEIEVFQSAYDAKLNLVSKSESEVVNDLTDGKASIAVLSRRLSDDELHAIGKRKITPRTTPFATDGIALIRNRSSTDTLVDLAEVIGLLQGKNSAIKGLVFDNPNSSTARQLFRMAGISAPPATVYSMGTNQKTIGYIAAHDDMVGVVGLNWIDQPSPETANAIEKIKVLGIKARDGKYYTPTQSNIAEGKYPLARELVVVDCQGYSGLGMGFASFVAGERGQRIVLKSGLLPAKIPARKILIRNSINKP